MRRGAKDQGAIDRGGKKRPGGQKTGRAKVLGADDRANDRHPYICIYIYKWLYMAFFNFNNYLLSSSIYGSVKRIDSILFCVHQQVAEWPVDGK